MNQFKITNGSRKVVIISQDGNVDARLYVGNGEIATPTSWNGKTEVGARKWACKVLARYDA